MRSRSDLACRNLSWGPAVGVAGTRGYRLRSRASVCRLLLRSLDERGLNHRRRRRGAAPAGRRRRISFPHRRRRRCEVLEGCFRPENAAPSPAEGSVRVLFVNDLGHIGWSDPAPPVDACRAGARPDAGGRMAQCPHSERTVVAGVQQPGGTHAPEPTRERSGR